MECGGKAERDAAFWRRGKKNGGFALRLPKHSMKPSSGRLSIGFLCGADSAKRFKASSRRLLQRHGRWLFNPFHQSFPPSRQPRVAPVKFMLKGDPEKNAFSPSLPPSPSPRPSFAIFFALTIKARAFPLQVFPCGRHPGSGSKYFFPGPPRSAGTRCPHRAGALDQIATSASLPGFERADIFIYPKLFWPGSA